MNVFTAVKETISTRQAAEFYGITVKRNGMARCPFHDDHTPSMKVDARFHCFGCGADGDVIDFAARFFNLNKKEAAEKLARDFGVAYDHKVSCQKARSGKSDAQKYKDAERYCFRVLSDYFQFLKEWETKYAPVSPDDEWHPLFVEALEMKAYVEYVLDLFIKGSLKERAVWIVKHGKEVTKLERQLSELTAGVEGSGHGYGGCHDITSNG